MLKRLHRYYFIQGEPMIWLTGAGLSLSLLMIVGLIVLVLWRGAGAFWQEDLVLLKTKDEKPVLAEILNREPMPAGEGKASLGFRIRTKIANRDLNGLDFRWIDEPTIVSSERPKDAVILERQEYGNFHGFLKSLVRDGQPLAFPAGGSALAELRKLHAEIRPAILKLKAREREEVGAINAELEKERLRVKTAERERPARLAEITAGSERRTAELKVRYEALRESLEKERALLSATKAVFADAAGQTKDIPVDEIVRIVLPNDLSLPGKVGLYFSRLGEFVFDEPRESNTEGGIFPAIFGTVTMVLMMSIVGVPLGVLTALYLREYAVQGRVVRIVRIAVNNLAGVPSIVFGIFGLGFFVYGIGSSIDRLFFSAALPSPTFGTGGILWCALTLALLTIPVVVVASEEALAAVPRGMREASLAIGATKWQTTYRVVLPAAAPGILTGLILAMARGTGEVAPLMIVGVVKLAPTLPVDSSWPFLHLERKIMHLGFHIYDVGFQSPNIEAALPMVYMTTVLLMLVIVALNLSAILIRNHLRRKLSASVF